MAPSGIAGLRSSCRRTVGFQIQISSEASGRIRPSDSFAVYQQMAGRTEGQDSDRHWCHAIPRSHNRRLSSKFNQGPSYQERYAAHPSPF